MIKKVLIPLLLALTFIVGCGPIMPPGWENGWGDWNIGVPDFGWNNPVVPPDWCLENSSPQFAGGPASVSSGQSASWKFSKNGCVDGSIWRNPPKYFEPFDRPAGDYFTRQVCTVSSRSSGQEFLRQNTYSTDRFLGFPGGQGSFSQAVPDGCFFSSGQLDTLADGDYTLRVWLESVYAAPQALGGYRVVTHQATNPSSTLFGMVADVQFKAVAFPDRGGKIISDDKKISCGLGETLCQAGYKKGQQVALTASAAPVGWLFGYWESSDSDLVCGEICKSYTVQPANTPVIEGCKNNLRCVVDTRLVQNITAVFKKKSEVLTVYKRGNGQGLVSSSPEGIDCGDTCYALFPINQEVVLTAEAAPGSYFERWGGACSEVTTLTCTVAMSQARDVEAYFTQMEAPAIEGPSVINPDPVAGQTSTQQWTFTAQGTGPITCYIEEDSLYIGESEDNWSSDSTVRRWQTNCLGSLSVATAGQRFETPLFWDGCPEMTSSPGCPESAADYQDVPEDPVLEARGKVQSLPDGEYTLYVEQKWIDSKGVNRGSVQSKLSFSLDRSPPEPIEIEGLGQEAITDGSVWTFDWGEDLTKTGPLELWPQRVSAEVQNQPVNRANVRCDITAEGASAPTVEGNWGECASSDTIGTGSITIENLADGKYFLDIYQRDRINQITKTRIPFYRLTTLQTSDETGKDLVRFGARWQNVYVASTRPPAPTESAIGEAWHPLRCGKGGAGLLSLCLREDDLSSTKPEDLDPELFVGTDLLYSRSIDMADKAQGYLRLATPGRFETRRSDRRYAHIRLFPQTKPEDGGFCLGWENNLNPATLQAPACEELPVDSASIELRGDPNIKLESNPEWNAQNTVSGNSELHVCVPGVPRALDGSEIVDLFDKQEGRLVQSSNRKSLVGAVPDEDCGGYVLAWFWSGNVLNNIVGAQYKGPQEVGGVSVCQAARPKETDVVAAPKLTDATIEEKIGFYRSPTSYTLPYQKPDGQVLWSGRAEGDPFLYQTAPWVSPISCQEGGYLSLSAGDWEPADIQAARGRDSAGLKPSSDPYGTIIPKIAEVGFGKNHFALPPQDLRSEGINWDKSDLDPGSPLEEEWLVNFNLKDPSALGARWFMDAKYYGYHLQRWAYQTDVASEKRWIEVFAPRSSR